jgi:hypothetical protein
MVPSDIEEPGAEPVTTTKGCALLECQTRSGVYIFVLLPSAALSRGIIKLYLLTYLHIARSGTPVHGPP